MNRSAENRALIRSVTIVSFPMLKSTFRNGKPRNGLAIPLRVSALIIKGRKFATVPTPPGKRLKPVPLVGGFKPVDIEVVGMAPDVAPICGESPQLWLAVLSVTISGTPDHALTIPEMYQPPITLSNALPMLNLWPLPAGSS